MPQVGGKSDLRMAAVTASILTEFFMSPDPHIDAAIHGRHAKNTLNASDTTIEAAIPFARKLWDAMRSSSSSIAIPHDAYLKMFVMQGRNLDFDTVIFDEAQDANPIMLKMLEDQYKQKTSRGNYSKLMYLGDRHQAIYEFRGAVNAMEKLPNCAKILPLTQSWRFGPKTAAYANYIIQELKGETLEIQGMGQDRAHTKKEPVAVISRTNSDLFKRAVTAGGEGIHWVGGIEGYRIQMLEDALRLFKGRPEDMKDPFMKKNFATYSDLTAAAAYNTDAKILSDIVKDYQGQIAEIVRKIKDNEVVNPADANLILTTAHKSKGLEWDHIQLADDYRNVFKTAEDNLAGKPVAFPEQEVNLMYVATTRARLSVDINHDMQEWHIKIDYHRSRRVRDFGSTDATAAPEAANNAKRGKSGAFGRIAKVPNTRIR